MESDAIKTLPHAAFKVLAILLVGNPEERNGTFAATDHYCRQFGLTSKETRHRCLQMLEQRGLFVCTRRGFKMRRVPTLYAVTWWPIHNWDGQPLKPPREATHAYLKWKVTENSHTDHRGDVTPIVGVMKAKVHPDLTPKVADLHPDGRGNSRVWPGVPDASHERIRDSALDSRIARLIGLQPHLLDGDIARSCHTDVVRVASIRERLAGGWHP